MGRNIGHEAMYWRLFAMVDPEVDVAISRDADSRLVKCEILMVNEWLASGKKFHVIRWNLVLPTDNGRSVGCTWRDPKFKATAGGIPAVSHWRKFEREFPGR